MSKRIDNSYVGDLAGNPDLTAGKTRTNPNAFSPANAVQAFGISKEGGCTYSPAFTWAYNAETGVFTFTPTSGHTTSDLRFWRFRIIDGDGNEVVGQSTTPSFSTITVNASALNGLTDWDVEFSAEITTSCGKCGADWLIRIPAGVL
jgi:hypothetical protein